MKKLFSLFIFFSLGNLYAQCIDFKVENFYGNDVFFADWNGIKFCEEEKKISVGTKTFLITRVQKNIFGDWIYYITEGGYGYPELGNIKVASTMDVIEVKYLAAFVQYFVESPSEKAEKDFQKKKKEIDELMKNIKSDQLLYPSLDKAIVKEDFVSAEEIYKNLKSKDTYPKTQEYRSLEKKHKLKEDHSLYEKIKLLIDESKILEATIEIKKLYYPELFPFLDEYNKKNDDLIIIEIKNNLTSNNFNNSAKLYRALKLPINQDQQFELIQSTIQRYFTSNPDSIPNDVCTKIINDNTVFFKELKPGKAKLKIDRKGDIFLNDKYIGTNNYVAEKTFEPFNIKIESEVSLNVSELSLPIGPKLNLVSTNKKLYKKQNSIIYKKLFFGGPGIIGLLFKHERIWITYDESIPENHLQIVQPTLKKLVINKTEIPLTTENTLVEDKKIKTRWLAISSRSLAFLFGFSWSTLRIYENSLIP